MIAQAAVLEALTTALEPLSANGVFIGRPVRASAPYAVIGEMAVADWSTKSERGRELRVAVTIRDEGESPARLHALMGEAEAAIEAMPRDLAGWRVASLVFLRSRVLREAAGPWAGLIEYRVRIMEG